MDIDPWTQAFKKKMADYEKSKISIPPEVKPHPIFFTQKMTEKQYGSWRNINHNPHEQPLVPYSFAMKPGVWKNNMTTTGECAPWGGGQRSVDDQIHAWLFKHCDPKSTDPRIYEPWTIQFAGATWGGATDGKSLVMASIEHFKFVIPQKQLSAFHENTLQEMAASAVKAIQTPRLVTTMPPLRIWAGAPRDGMVECEECHAEDDYCDECGGSGKVYQIRYGVVGGISIDKNRLARALDIRCDGLAKIGCVSHTIKTNDGKTGRADSLAVCAQGLIILLCQTTDPPTGTPVYMPNQKDEPPTRLIEL